MHLGWKELVYSINHLWIETFTRTDIDKPSLYQENLMLVFFHLVGKNLHFKNKMYSQANCSNEPQPFLLKESSRSNMLLIALS